MRIERLSAHTPIERQAGGFAGLALPYARPFDTPAGPVEFDRGAFAESLRRDGHRVRIVYGCDETEPIGRPTELRERSDGLWVRARVSATRRGLDARRLLRDGILREITVGFDAEGESGRDPRRIHRARLWWISLAPWSAAGPAGARVHEIHRRTPQVETADERRGRQLREAQDYVRRMRQRITPSRQERELVTGLLRHLRHRFSGGDINVSWFDARIGPKDRLGSAVVATYGPSRITLTVGLGPWELTELALHEFAHVLYRHRVESETTEAEAEAFADALRGDPAIRAIVQRTAIEPEIRARLEAEYDRMAERWRELEPWYSIGRRAPVAP